MHMQVYIVDFGLAAMTPDRERAAQDTNYIWTNFQGTPDYASCDALHSLKCSAKVQYLTRQLTCMQLTDEALHAKPSVTLLTLALC